MTWLTRWFSETGNRAHGAQHDAKYAWHTPGTPRAISERLYKGGRETMTWYKGSFVTHLNAGPSKKGRLGQEETATCDDSEGAGKLREMQKTQAQTLYFT